MKYTNHDCRPSLWVITTTSHIYKDKDHLLKPCRQQRETIPTLKVVTDESHDHFTEISESEHQSLSLKLWVGTVSAALCFTDPWWSILLITQPLWIRQQNRRYTVTSEVPVHVISGIGRSARYIYQLCVASGERERTRDLKDGARQICAYAARIGSTISCQNLTCPYRSADSFAHHEQQPYCSDSRRAKSQST